MRERVWQKAFAEAGTLEKYHATRPHYRNENARITAYHRSVSGWLSRLKPVPPYCASFVWYCFTQAGLYPRVPEPARARSWFVHSRIILTQPMMRGNRRMLVLPKKGDIIGYNFNGSQISHIEVLERIDLDAGYLWAMGGNTSNSAALGVNRDGEGTYYVRRKLNSFLKISEIVEIKKK